MAADRRREHECAAREYRSSSHPVPTWRWRLALTRRTGELLIALGHRLTSEPAPVPGRDLAPPHPGHRTA